MGHAWPSCAKLNVAGFCGIMHTTLRIPLQQWLLCAQCIARDVDGRRKVAGVHWDYDCYGAPGKIAQVRQRCSPRLTYQRSSTS